jgi:hypothetical protein
MERKAERKTHLSAFYSVPFSEGLIQYAVQDRRRICPDAFNCNMLLEGVAFKFIISK